MADAAAALLNKMPTAEQLMPPLQIAAVEALLGKQAAPMSKRSAGDAIGFGGKPGRPPARLKPEPQPSAAVGQTNDAPNPWDDIAREWRPTP
jgi:hypothetical protein